MAEQDNRRGLRLILLGSLTGITLFCTAPVAAQPTAPAKSTADSGELQEITVTARRRGENLQDVPGEVTAFSAADLEKAGVEEPSQFLNQTAGVFFRNNTTAGTSFTNIRGITESRNAESPVAVVIDGVFLNNPLSFQNQLVDISQIEVLKGPQGALFGRNADAGAILITTEQPTNDFGGFVKAGVGRHDENLAEAAFGGPIIEDKLLFRVVGYHTADDGYLKDVYLSKGNDTVYGDGQSNSGGRGRLLFTPTVDLRFDTRFSYASDHSGFNNAVFDPSNTGSASIMKKIFYAPDIPGGNDRQIYDASEKIDYTTRYGTLTSISAYDNYQESSAGDSLPYSPCTCDGTQWLKNTYETESEELRFTSPDSDRLRWIGGGYWQHTARFYGSGAGLDEGNQILIIDPTGATSGSGSANPATSISADHIDQTSWATFGQAAYDILDTLELAAALRFDHDSEKDTNIAPTKIVNPDGSFTWVPGPGGRLRGLTFTKPQPKVTLRYKPDASDNFYVSYGQGFKNGGFNPSTIPQPSQRQFGAETATTYEAGYKGSFFDHRVNVDVAGYYSDIQGLNYFDFILALENQINFNIDKVRVYGADLAASARLTDELTVTGTVSPDSSRIEQNSLLPASVGHRAPAYPDNLASLAVDWERQIRPEWSIFAHADYQYVGNVQWDLLGNTVRPPLNLLDLRLGVNYQDGKSPWRIELYCRNCTDLNYVNEGVVLANGAIGTVDFYSKDTLAFGVEVTKHF